MATFPLKNGSSGEAVKAAQKWLNVALEVAGRTDRLKEDGKFGPATAAVIRSLFARDEISAQDYDLMRKSASNLVKRQQEIRKGGPNAQALLNKLVQTDQANYSNLLRILRAYDRDTEGGRRERAEIYGAAVKAAMRLKARVARLKTNQQNIVFKFGSTEADRELVRKYGGISGIGAAQLVVVGAVVLVALIVGGAATVAIYEWLTPAYKESTIDFVETERLRKALEKLTPEEKAVVLEEAEKQVDEAYATGQRDGALGGAGSTIKLLLYGAGAWFLWTGVIEPQIDKRRARKAA